MFFKRNGDFPIAENRAAKAQKQPREVFYEKKVFVEIPKNSEENTCARVSFFSDLSCFPVSFAKFLKTHFLQNTSRPLLLKATAKNVSKDMGIFYHLIGCFEAKFRPFTKGQPHSPNGNHSATR